MSNLEMKINAMFAVLTAETFEERDKAMADLKQSMAEKLKPDDTLEGIVRDLFLEFSVPDHLLGYDYAVMAVTMAVEDVKWVNNITFGLYPHIAVAFDTTASRVERAIRYFIEETIDRGNQELITKHFGHYINPDSGKVSNGEFVARMANLVKQKMRHM